MNKPVKTYTGNKPNYVAEAPYQPGYEDAVVTEPNLTYIFKAHRRP